MINSKDIKNIPDELLSAAEYLKKNYIDTYNLLQEQRVRAHVCSIMEKYALYVDEQINS